MRRVESVTTIAAKPATVQSAFLEESALRTWWGVERTLVQPREGGVYVLAWEACDRGYRYLNTGRIAILERGRLLVIEDWIYINPQHRILGPMTLTVETMRTGMDYSSLRVVQAGFERGPDWDWYHDAVQDAWPGVLERVRYYVEGGRTD